MLLWLLHKQRSPVSRLDTQSNSSYQHIRYRERISPSTYYRYMPIVVVVEVTSITLLLLLLLLLVVVVVVQSAVAHRHPDILPARLSRIIDASPIPHHAISPYIMPTAPRLPPDDDQS